MIFNQNNRAIAAFPSLEAAGQEFDRLILSGFPLENLFLMGQNLSTCVQNSKTVQMKSGVGHPGTLTGTALGLAKGLMAGNIAGGITGVLLSLGILALPGIGQIALTSAAILTLFSGGMGVAAGGMIGALVGLGITEKQAERYSQKVSQGHYLLIISGTEQEFACAKRILGTVQPTGNEPIELL
jgi:hypothetical protein